jgi:uncharacterized delta-60 repeat protein
MFKVESLESRRMMAFGSIDTSFGTGGRVDTAINNPAVTDLTVVSGGKVLAGGSSGLVRYSSAGVIDTTFGSSGIVQLSGVALKGIGVNASGQIYALVSASAGTVLLRYTSAGALDSTFGTGGTALVSSSRTFTPSALAVQSDGKLLIAGTVRTNNGDGATTRVYRRKADGTGDTTFGSGGLIDFTLGSTNVLTPVAKDVVSGIAVTGTGKILIGGGSLAWAPSFTDPDTNEFIEAAYGDTMFASARLTSSGALDSTYGSGGIARSTYASGGSYGLPSAFTMKSDGSVVLGAVKNKLTVAQFSASGTLSFDQEVPDYGIGGPLDMVALSDGRVVVLAQPTDGYYSSRGLAFATLDGSGNLGNIVRTNTTQGMDGNQRGAIAVASDGKLLIGGTTSDANIEIAKFDKGNVGDARPDNFTGGENNAMIEDASGGLHLAYYDVVANNLKYAYRDPRGMWSPTVVVDSTPYSGQYVSIALKSNNIPGIAYFCGNTGDLKYASTTNKTSWSLQTVESAGSVGLYPSLQFTTNDNPTITYYKKTTGDLRFAIFSGTAWGYETVESANDVGRSSSLAIDPFSNHFTVAYVSSTTGDVRFASHQKGGTWAIQTVAKTKGADFLTLAYDYSTAYVSYYDAYNGDLRLASKYYYDTTWSDQLIASKGAVGLYNKQVTNYYTSEVFAYNRTLNKVSMFDYNGTETTIVSGAGKFLSVAHALDDLNLAYYDTTLGVLKVRFGPALN